MLSVRLRAEKQGGHVRVGVWTGTRPGQTRGKAGELVLREEEWAPFRDALRAGLPGSEYPEVMVVEERGFEEPERCLRPSQSYFTAQLDRRWHCSLEVGHGGDHVAYENHDLTGELAWTGPWHDG